MPFRFLTWRTYSSAFAGAGIPFEMDLESERFTYVGPQAESLVGYPAHYWFRSGVWMEMIHPEDLESATQFMRPDEGQVTATTDYKAEFRLLRADQIEMWVRVVVRYLRGEDDRYRARGFFVDVTESKQYEQAIESARDLLRELALRNQQIREHERANVAREIHDELGQSLTFLRIELANIENDLERFAPQGALATLQRRMAHMNNTVDGTLRAMRRIISNLRPAVLDELGLKAAIEWQAGEFSRRAGIRCTVEAEAIDNVGKEESITLFRVFQEILTNVLKHAHASRVTVRTACNRKGFVMTVIDNGRGFSTAERRPDSFGLLGVKERIEALNGTLEIKSAPGQGTTVTIFLPM